MASLAHQNRPVPVGPCALRPGSPDSPKQAMCTSLLQDHTMPKLSPRADARQREEVWTYRDSTNTTSANLS